MGLIVESLFIELFKPIGLESAALYAGLTFGFFIWVDSDVSPDVKDAVSRWLKRRRFDRRSVTDAIVQIFDRIYGNQLFSLRSLMRSALISTVLTIIYFFQVSRTHPRMTFDEFVAFSFYSNVVSDYLSLFFVRWMLTRFPGQPIVSLLLGAFVGTLVISVFYLFRILVPVLPFGEQWDVFVVLTQLAFKEIWELTTSAPSEMLSTHLIPPALSVHLWLILMALAAFLIRLVNSFMRSVSFVERIIKKEESQSLRAIAYVAAVVVFVSVVAVSFIGRVLP